MSVKLVLPIGLDGFTPGEIEMKSYFDRAVAEVDGRDYYPITFADPMGYGHEDIKRMEEYGRCCETMATLVVIPAVTIPHMERAVEQLYARGYFEQFVPLTADEMHRGIAEGPWPPERRLHGRDSE